MILHPDETFGGWPEASIGPWAQMQQVLRCFGNTYCPITGLGIWRWLWLMSDSIAEGPCGIKFQSSLRFRPGAARIFCI